MEGEETAAFLLRRTGVAFALAVAALAQVLALAILLAPLYGVTRLVVLVEMALVCVWAVLVWRLPVRRSSK